MPVRMTELIAQIPIVVAKNSVQAADIIAEISFDLELDLAEDTPDEVPVESHDFMQIGQILREMAPMDARLEGMNSQPQDPQAKLVVNDPAVEMVESDLSQQVIVAPTKLFTRNTSKTEADSGAEKAEVLPKEATVNVPARGKTSMEGISEPPPAPDILPFLKPSDNAHVVGKFGNAVPERAPDIVHKLAHPQSGTPRNELPSIADAKIGKPPASKAFTAAEVLGDITDFGTGISERQQVNRPLVVSSLAAPPTATQPQSAEAKIISQISSAISNPLKGTIEIRLDPPELGRVIISITQNESGLSATVTSEKAEVADLLRRHSELLSRELSKSGFSDASLEFSHRDQREARSIFDEYEALFSSVSPEQTEATSTIEAILQSQSGSLDIRL